MQEVLVINNLNYQVFKNFYLTIDNNKFISIIGANNSGKTTLFKVISGIIPTNNIVKVSGEFLNRSNVNNYIKQLGIVIPFSDKVFLFDKVIDELHYPLENLGYSEIYIKRQISKILNLFPLDIKDKKIKELTNYEKQALLFCLSLLHNPKVLLIDDVFNHMNSKDSKKIIKVLKAIKKLTIINFSSNLNNGDISDYLYVLDKGEIVLEGKYYHLLEEYKLLIKLGIEIPFVINLSNKLKEEGLISHDYFKLEDLVDAVWQ